MRHRRRPRISVRLPARGSVLLAAVALLAGALTTPAIADPITAVASSAAADPAAPPTADGVALSQAVSSGRSVVVDSATTETSQLVAQPDGTLQLTSSMQPVRAHTAAGWVPLDTRLTQAADGTLVPAASPTNVAFSGGGAGPLVTMTDPTGAAISMSWPAPLPAPTVAGSAATYASVLPGVDLTLTATADSYSEVLIVKNAAAAANPALTQLRMNVTASGVTLVNSGGGGLAAVDAAGATVFRAAQPTMWDSGKHQSLGATPTATDAGGGTLTPLKTTIASTTAAATGPTAAAASTVTLYPPIAALTGPGVTYPLFIDPGFTRNRAHWATFFNNGWKYFDLATEQLRVGFCDDNHLAGCSGIGVGRTMFSFDTSALAPRNAVGAHIYAADVSITQIHGANGCTPEPTQLLVGGTFTAATSWPGPLGSQLDVASSGAGDQCPSNLSNRIHFTGAGTVNYLQKAADTGNGLLSFGLLAVNEGDWTQWKRFNYDAQVAVTFNYPPSGPVATGVAAPAFRCGATTYVPSRTVQLGGTATDNNSPVLPLKLTYNVYVGANPNPAAILTSSPVASGSTAMATINFASDGDFQYDVQASNNVGTSGGSDLSTGKSGRVAFTVDTLPPAGTPTISSEDYPRDFWGSPANQGVFTLTDGSATTAVGFAYSWDDPASIQKPSNSTCGYTMPNGTTGGWVADTGGTASLKVPAGLTVGPHTLYVRDFDAGHNMSAGTIGNGMASYHFYVSPFTYPQETTARYEGDLNFGTVATTAGVSVDSNNAPTTVGTASAYRESGAGLGWSGNAQEHLTASTGIPFDPTKPAQHGPQFKFTFTAPIDADYAFGVKMTKFNHYGQVQFSLTDNSTSTVSTFKDPNTSTPVTFDGYSPTVATEYRALGGQHMTAGNHTLTVTVVGKNPSSADNGAGDGGFSAGLDYFTIVPINNVVYAGYYQGQNNNGIANDGTVANLDFKNNSISENSLLAAGWQFGANPVVDNVPFHITAPYAGGLDNIVATGQTITEGSGTTVPNYLDLLVLSTNGNTLSNATTQVTINYSPPQSQPSGTYNTVVMPSVPDWYSAPLKAPVIGSADGGTTTSSIMTNAFPITAQTPQSPLYVNNGVTPNHSIHPMIYHIRINLALNQLLNGNGYPVKSVTLPNYNTAFLPNQNALHVIAITYNTN